MWTCEDGEREEEEEQAAVNITGKRRVNVKSILVLLLN